MFIIFLRDTGPPEIYTLSQHDALPIPPPRHLEPPRSSSRIFARDGCKMGATRCSSGGRGRRRDRKSTRLNSSHANISYAVFCLKHLTRYVATSLHILSEFTYPSLTVYI